MLTATVIGSVWATRRLALMGLTAKRPEMVPGTRRPAGSNAAR